MRVHRRHADMWRDDGLETVTEYRAGTYIFNDRSLLQHELCLDEDCALFVLATVVSLPTPGRAIIDAGSKSLTSDLMGCNGFGIDRKEDASCRHFPRNTGFSTREMLIGRRVLANKYGSYRTMFARLSIFSTKSPLRVVRTYWASRRSMRAEWFSRRQCHYRLPPHYLQHGVQLCYCAPAAALVRQAETRHHSTSETFTRRRSAIDR